MSFIEDPANGVDTGALRFCGGHYWQRDWLYKDGEEQGWKYLCDMKDLVDQMERGEAATEPSGASTSSRPQAWSLSDSGKTPSLLVKGIHLVGDISENYLGNGFLDMLFVGQRLERHNGIRDLPYYGGRILHVILLGNP